MLVGKRKDFLEVQFRVSLGNDGVCIRRPCRQGLPGTALGNTPDGKVLWQIQAVFNSAAEVYLTAILSQHVGQTDCPGCGRQFKCVFAKNPVCRRCCHVDMAQTDLVAEVNRHCL